MSHIHNSRRQANPMAAIVDRGVTMRQLIGPKEALLYLAARGVPSSVITRVLTMPSNFRRSTMRNSL